MSRQKTILITGAARGIGAATAMTLADRGHRIVINYREKQRRADTLVDEIRTRGGEATAVRADLTQPDQVSAMVSTIRETVGSLDALVLNASGGLERGASPGYPMSINRDAQTRLLELAMPLLSDGSRVVFVTSHQAHFVSSHEVPADYHPVAISKRAGEDSLRSRQSALARAGIGLTVVSGDMIEGTIIVRLLERRDSHSVDERRDAAPLPTIEEFADAIADEAVRAGTSSRTVFVGGSDYLVSP